MNFEIKGKHIAAAVVLGVFFGVIKYQCDSVEPPEKVEAEAEEVVELTPEQRLASLEATGAVASAHQEAINASMREVNRRLHIAERQREQKAPAADEVDVLTILFSANIHGEREDCGCKRNPLGGLSRRQTLVELAREHDSKPTEKWWGSELPAPDAVFNVDAGDLLFKSTSLEHHPEEMQNKAREHARAVVAGLGAHAPDVVNVGELDLVFGLDTYRDYVAKASFPVVSANLYTKEGERPFDGHQVVSRDGKKVAFVGLLKPKSRVHEYYKKRELDVRDPQKAYVDELAKLPDDVDLVVMLSNLGMNDTTDLVETLVEEGARVDAAVVSNTNRLTRSPEWAAGVPVVEPLSRGKYFGRLDLRLGEEPGVAYANAVEDPRKVVQDYRRAWSSYFSAREQERNTAREIAELEREFASQKERARETDEKLARKEGGKDGEKEGGEGKGDAERFVDAAGAKAQSRIEFLKKKLPTLQKRVETTSKAVADQVAKLGTIDDMVAYGDGDDWASVRIVQVKLEIPQDRKVRRVLDRLSKGD
ncbi:hypothetical protein FIV42_00425 [Persicimonas caeni]|uniref:5'-nucleotidase n=1 Tax=Persicimonas caeni TaxID=2292766 RepID=A0A4Y6PLU9_PERCE|nr:hypothetical protein [Persicimonas caeni]QDG49258.1 hypothetical protein FIV42_00425 [Persicimonas caeni]QED30479.1 hypothetical protein FRD00_00420 [Persicimonas caeni]